MSKYAIIVDGVVDTIAKSSPEFAASQGWIEAPAHVGPGWGYDGGNWSEPPAPSADEARAKLRPLSRAQFAGALALSGTVTAAEARAWGKNGDLPSFVIAAIEGSDMSDNEKLLATIKAESAIEIERLSPIVALLRAAKGLTDDQVDTLFTTGAAI